MLATLLRPTSGTASVNGHDIINEPDAVRRSIGFVFQDPTLDTELTGRENLDFHGRIYGLKRELRQQRIKEMLEIVQLTDRANDFVKIYSGGMKRRLEIARGLLHYPSVLFLDEPTLGLDPQTRRAIWEHIRRLNQDENITIILTTHYTEEADHLCDYIQIIDFGKIVALDTPDNLKARLEGDIISLVFNDSGVIPRIRSILMEKDWISRIDVVTGGTDNAALGGMIHKMQGASGRIGVGGIMPGMGHGSARAGGKLPKHVHQLLAQDMTGQINQRGLDEGPRSLNLLVDDGGHRIPEIVKLADTIGVVIESVELHKPTLDDVFLSVTGRNIRDEKGSFLDTVRRYRIVQQARK